MPHSQQLFLLLLKPDNIAEQLSLSGVRFEAGRYANEARRCCLGKGEAYVLRWSRRHKDARPNPDRLIDI